MKLHDLKPAPGSRKARTRVGRGIAGGKGKTAGRGTKGQKSRAGGKIPAWFEGGQTPMHIRLPKLHGFKQRGRIEYQVVNVGRISEYAVAGRFGAEAGKAPLTINSEVLLGAGLISSERRPVKVLGNGDVEAKLFVAADAFTKGARSKIEAAGGFVQLLAPERASAPEAEPEAAPEAEAPAAVAEPAEAKPESRTRKTDGLRAEPDAQAAPESTELSAADDAEGDADSTKPKPTEGKATATTSRGKASAASETAASETAEPKSEPKSELARPTAEAAPSKATSKPARPIAKATKAAKAAEPETSSEPAKPTAKAAATTAGKRPAKPAASSKAVPAADDPDDDDASDADAPADADADAPAKRGRTRRSADPGDA